MIETGDLENAVRDCEAGVKLNPGLADGFYNLGNAEAALGRNKAAVEAYTKGITIQPKRADYYCARGAVYKSLGRPDEAQKDFNSALAIDPNHPDALNNRGTILWLKRNVDKAGEDFRRALNSDPTHLPALKNLAALHLAGNHPDEAIQILSRGAKVGKDDPEVLATLGDAWMLKENWKRALSYYEALLRKNLSRELRLKVLARSGQALEKQGKLKDAQRRYEKAREEAQDQGTRRGLEQRIADLTARSAR